MNIRTNEYISKKVLKLNDKKINQVNRQKTHQNKHNLPEHKKPRKNLRLLEQLRLVRLKPCTY